jgi:NADH-quinone oxidoreductase subunit C
MSEPGPLHTELKVHFGAAVGAGWQDPPFEVLELDRAEILKAVSYLKASRSFDALMDLTAVDYLKYQSVPKAARFELVYSLMSFSTRQRIRIKVAVPDTDPVAPSLTPLYGNANWLEREVWDMYGIRFTGHPNLQRILMYEEFSGHPLRKDYPLMHQQPRVRQVFPGVPPFGETPEKLKDAPRPAGGGEGES